MAAALATLLAPLSTWFWSTATTVHGPYLDEIFHVRQAQHYCQGSFDIWDPKITTPPGLYVLSTLGAPLWGCDITILRGVSAVCLCLLLLVVNASYAERSNNRRSAALVQHCALNVALFPPLFFFSGLYYTDVASTLSVVVFYWLFLRLHRVVASNWWRFPCLVGLGVVSLCFRQTNIFWVAVFPAGLTLVHELDRGHEAIRHSAERKAEGFGDTFLSVARMSYKLEVVYDPPVRDAWFEDYLKTILSIATCLVGTLTRPQRLWRLVVQLTPYLAILGCFTGFIAWNGGVVLGDKSNHVATIHLAQMLYLWPYITFFSWPLTWPYLLTLPLGLLAQISPMAPLESMLIFQRKQVLPRATLLVAFTALALAIAHFNTIVHPFTLADNRHYTFYVFRLLTRPRWMKYIVTPIYTLSAWASLSALGARPAGTAAATSKSTQNPIDTTKAPNPVPTPHRPLRIPDGVQSARTSFALIWLAASALQLVTAPLVEPRYFILPWLFWRIHLPLQRARTAPGKEGKERREEESWFGKVDFRLVLETGWCLFVQAATGYVFLFWGFEWRQEPGAVQRFMW